MVLAVQLAAEQAKNLLLTVRIRNAEDENETLKDENETLKAENEALKAQSAGFEWQAHYQYGRHSHYMFKDLDNHRKRKAAEAELAKILDEIEKTVCALEGAAKKPRK